MQKLQDKESQRLKSVNSYLFVEDARKEDFDQIAKVASILSGAPSVLISFMEEHRHNFISNYGIDLKEVPREEAFCEFLLKNCNQPLIVENTNIDPRFSKNKYVTGYPHIKFYAGFPIINEENFILGTLCVIDHKERQLSDQQFEGLKSLANQILQIFELQKKTRDLEISKALFKDKSERFSNIIEASNVGTWEWNLNTGNVIYNDKLAEILGYELDELKPVTKDSLYSRIHKNDIKNFQKTLSEYFNGMTNFYSCEYRLRHKNGSWVWILDRGRIVKWNDDDVPLLMFGTHSDITERKLATQKVTFTNRRLKIAQRIARLGYWELDKRTKNTYWSNQIYKIWNLPDDSEIFNIDYIIKTIHPEDVESFKANFFNEQSIDENNFYFRIVFEDSSFKWIRCTTTNKGHNSKRIEGTFQDVTFQKLLKLSLVASEKRNSDLFQLMPIPCWVYNLNTLQIIQVNKAAIKNYGYSREEFLNMTIKEMRPEEEIKKLIEVVEHTKKNIDVRKVGGYLHKKKDGSIFKVEVHSNQLSTETDPLRVVMAVDISETLEHIQEIEDKNRRLQEIARVQSHVVRAPLAKMMGIVELVNEELPLDADDNKMFLNEFLNSAVELDEIIRSISKKASLLTE
ncbi:PAS domain S-box protein [Leeuwenhoekiella sp. NPDC079379]|uniref:PAS domain S-box protein n=1 Tax=Leeuwenhoekiella sp. NPDC079379 TaxID=3364122 RepID=UPI0037C5BABC